MAGAILSLLVIAGIIFGLFKRWQPQFILYTAGLVLLFAAIIMGVAPEALMPAKAKGTGFIFFDPFAAIGALMSNRVASLGLVIMTAGGFAKYMNTIGASRALVDWAIQPLRLIKSPYIVLAAAFLIGQALKMFIPSASGLGLMLMVTIFPVLMRLGLGPLSSTAAVACTGGIDFGPADGQAILAANTASIEVSVYFVKSLPVVFASVAAVAVSLVIVQKFMDARAGHTIEAGRAAYDESHREEVTAPKLYLLLPALPLIMLLVFSPYGISTVRINVPTVMFMSIFVAAICELVRHKADVKRVFKELMAFFEGMGAQFTAVVSLIIGGELFAQGLMAIGAVDSLISAVQSSGLHSNAMILIMTACIGVTAIIMGSGNAPFFAFAALVPKMAQGMGTTALNMIMPMQFAAGIGRMMSPITGAMIAEAGIAGISPFDLVRRTFIPMLCGMVASTLVSLMIN